MTSWCVQYVNSVQYVITPFEMRALYQQSRLDTIMIQNFFIVIHDFYSPVFRSTHTTTVPSFACTVSRLISLCVQYHSTRGNIRKNIGHLLLSTLENEQNVGWSREECCDRGERHIYGSFASHLRC
jgi:hypothetical protein